MRLLSLVLMCSCAALAQDAKLAKLRAELIEADKAFGVEAARNGVDGFVSCFAEKDILKFSGPGAPPQTTREEARAAMKKAYEGRPFNLKWTPLKADAAVSGDLGYTFGSWVAGDRKGHYVSIWKRQPDG